MRIEKLHLKNFRCFKELDITFPKDPKIDPKGSNLAVFIGLNGAGKSTILDAIYLLLSSYKEKNKNLYTPDDIHIGESLTENKIVFHFSNATREWPSDSDDYQEKKESNKPENIEFIDEHLFCAYYKSGRKESNSAILNDNYSPVSNDEDSFTDYISFEKWFKQEEDIERRIKENPKNINYINRVVQFVKERIKNFLMEMTGIDFKTLSFKNENKNLYINDNIKELKFSQLSDGQKILIYLVGSIAHQLAKNIDRLDYDGESKELFIDYFRDYSEEVERISKFSGVVLIDEIELHLHPQWQREVLPALQKTFPNIQFIVTTHSPQVLSNLKKEEVFILKDNKIVEVTPHIEGRDSNSILYELFGVEERPERFKTQLKQLYNAIDDENLSEAKEILAELTAAFGEQDTEIVRANLHLSFAEE